MGGIGSGRHQRSAPRTDAFHKLDLASFKRHWFDRNSTGKVTWSRVGRQTGSINYRLSQTCMVLSYALHSSIQTEHVEETIPFGFTDQHFGGKRRWLTCKSCNRLCRVLYGGAYFRCRKCYRITFERQYEPIHIPGLAAAERSREKLSGKPGFIHPFPDKPQGMHWKTYRRLESADYDALRNMELALMGKLAGK